MFDNKLVDIKNLYFNFLIKIGLKKKPERVGIKIQNSSDIRIINSRFSGFDKGIDASNVKGLDLKDTEVN